MPRGPGSDFILVGESEPLRELRRLVARAAATDVPVLLLGETGTGKSLVARVVHGASGRREGPFVAINCAALPDALVEAELFGHRRGAFTGATEDREGLLASAERGTVLLDEVGDLPPSQQAKLLTVLEDGEVRPVGARRAVALDVRVLSATSSPLEKRVRERTFRIDLFHRLALLTLRIPPLRERAGDLPVLAAHFLRAAAKRHALPAPRLDDAALGLLADHAWPGNVRELAHALEAALILGGERGLATALRGVLEGGPAVAADPATGDAAVGNAGADAARYSFYGSGAEERRRIRAALDRCRGNRTRAARELGMARNTLRERMRRYDL